MNKMTQWQKKLRPLLHPLSRVYAFIMRQRRAFYFQGKISQYQPLCPTLSIGNISVGGTGKTPIASWMLDWAEEKNLSAVVLSRGYGARKSQEPVIVDKNTSVSLAGDEPLQLAKNHPKAKIITYAKRAVSAHFAEHTLSPDILILDDGMQHLAVNRHVDIIILHERDVDERWDNVLPKGLWREGKEALSSASAFAMKIEPKTLKQKESSVQKKLEKYGVPFFSFILKGVALQPLCSSQRTEPAQSTPFHHVKEIKEYLLLSGVGNADQVESTATTLTGRKPLIRLDYHDHYNYSQKDVKHILLSAGSLPIICTEKDAVKLEPLLPFFKNHPLFVMKVKAEFGPVLFTKETFPTWWDNTWNKLQQKTT